MEQLLIINSPLKKVLFMKSKIFNKQLQNHRKPGGMKGEFYMADDFDETPECFKE